MWWCRVSAGRLRRRCDEAKGRPARRRRSSSRMCRHSWTRGVRLSERCHCWATGRVSICVTFLLNNWRKFVRHSLKIVCSRVGRCWLIRLNWNSDWYCSKLIYSSVSFWQITCSLWQLIDPRCEATIVREISVLSFYSRSLPVLYESPNAGWLRFCQRGPTVEEHLRRHRW